MTSQPTLTRALLATSQWSPEGSQANNASSDASISRMTPLEPIECLQTNIEADIKIITAYLVKERALEVVQAALNRISDAYRRRAKQKSMEQAIHQLQVVVEKLADKVENKPYGAARPGSYATAAAAGLGPPQTRTQQSLNAGHVTSQKLVPLCHKHEIVVV